MNMKFATIASLFGALLVLQVSLAAAPPAGDARTVPDLKPGEALADRPLADFQIRLLELAFDAASAIPLDPHIRDRSRSQEQIVAACLELHQPTRAIRFIDKIDDWRRGSAYADCALYCVRNGYFSEARRSCDRADVIAERAEDWRRDAIRSKIAKARTLLEQSQTDAALESRASNSATNNGESKPAETVGDDFDAQIASINQDIATGDFDLTKAVLESLSNLFDRFYSDLARRDLVEQKIKSSWAKLPYMIRIETMMSLAKSAISHNDKSKALELVNQTQEIIDSQQWLAEDRIPLRARVARLRYSAGDAAQARSDADAALAIFEQEREQVINIDRAGVLCSVAEAFAAMGDQSQSLGVYRRAIDAGIENPNSRPRAEDLASTCCSMAISGIEPDADTWANLHRIRQGLGQPW